MNKTNLANLITYTRIILVIGACLFVKSSLFFVIYSIAGITDILDGYIARKLKIQTDYGARLDSIADLLLFIILSVWTIVFKLEIIKTYYLFLLLLFVFKISVIFINYLRFKKIVIIHTIGNKILGFLIFLIPIVVNYISDTYYLITLIIASLVISDELLIVITSKSLNYNQKSFLDKEKR